MYVYNYSPQSISIPEFSITPPPRNGPSARPSFPSQAKTSGGIFSEAQRQRDTSGPELPQEPVTRRGAPRMGGRETP